MKIRVSKYIVNIG